MIIFEFEVIIVSRTALFQTRLRSEICPDRDRKLTKIQYLAIRCWLKMFKTRTSNGINLFYKTNDHSWALKMVISIHEVPIVLLIHWRRWNISTRWKLSLFSKLVWGVHVRTAHTLTIPFSIRIFHICRIQPM